MDTKKLLTITRLGKQEKEEPKVIEKSQYRIDVQKKLEKLEKEGKFV